jgi:hypothetical protein
MRDAHQPMVERFGGKLALRTRRERGVWSLHGTNTEILATVRRGFKAPPHLDHILSHVRRFRDRAGSQFLGCVTRLLAHGWSSGRSSIILPEEALHSLTRYAFSAGTRQPLARASAALDASDSSRIEGRIRISSQDQGPQ